MASLPLFLAVACRASERKENETECLLYTTHTHTDIYIHLYVYISIYVYITHVLEVSHVYGRIGVGVASGCKTSSLSSSSFVVGTSRPGLARADGSRARDLLSAPDRVQRRLRLGRRGRDAPMHSCWSHLARDEGYPSYKPSEISR